MLDGQPDAALGEPRFGVHIQEALRRAGGVARDEQPLDQEVRVAVHDVPVLVDAGLALFGVHHDVAHAAASRPRALPLAAGGEVGSAPAQQTGAQHLVDHLLRLHGERPLQSGVAAAGEAGVEAFGVDIAGVGEEEPVLRLPECSVLGLADGGRGGVGGDLRRLLRRHTVKPHGFAAGALDGDPRRQVVGAIAADGHDLDGCGVGGAAGGFEDGPAPEGAVDVRVLDLQHRPAVGASGLALDGGLPDECERRSHGPRTPSPRRGRSQPWRAPGSRG